MYPVSLGSLFQVSQTVPGGGTFDGSEQGRAALVLGSGTSAVSMRAALYGASANAVTVQFLDLGAGTASNLLVTSSGTAIVVTLGRTTSALTSTSAQVAAALNAALNLPIRANYGGDGSGIVAAAAATALTGGVDPGIFHGNTHFGWKYPASSNAGLFYFENTDGLIIRDLQASFTGITGSTPHAQFLRVNLDSALNVIAGTGIPVFEADFSTAQPSIGLTDVRIPMLPGQALQCLWSSGSGGGLVRVIACRDARFPFV